MLRNWTAVMQESVSQSAPASELESVPELELESVPESVPVSVLELD